MGWRYNNRRLDQFLLSMIHDSEIEYFENDTERGLKFQKGVDPKLLIDKIFFVMRNERNGFDLQEVN